MPGSRSQKGSAPGGTGSSPASALPELSSIHTALGDLARRVASIAEESGASDTEDVSTQLYAVERALTEAHRRLEVLTRARL